MMTHAIIPQVQYPVRNENTKNRKQESNDFNYLKGIETNMYEIKTKHIAKREQHYNSRVTNKRLLVINNIEGTHVEGYKIGMATRGTMRGLRRRIASGQTISERNSRIPAREMDKK